MDQSATPGPGQLDLPKPHPTRGKKLPADILTRAELGALLGACSRRYPTGVRNRALLVVLWRAGLRISEALDLRPRDLDADGTAVRVVKGKGSKGRTVPIDAGAWGALEHWLAIRRELKIPGSSPVFCTLKGGRVAGQYVRALLPRLAKRAGVEKRVHAHIFRHTYAAELEREGMRVALIQRLLGHENLKTTSEYLQHVGTSAELAHAVGARPSWGA